MLCSKMVCNQHLTKREAGIFQLYRFYGLKPAKSIRWLWIPKRMPLQIWRGLRILTFTKKPK